MGLFFWSARANRKRVLPTGSWVSTRMGIRVGPLPTGLEPADAPPEAPPDPGPLGAGVAAPPQAPTMRATAATNAASGNARPEGAPNRRWPTGECMATG